MKLQYLQVNTVVELIINPVLQIHGIFGRWRFLSQKNQQKCFQNIPLLTFADVVWKKRAFCQVAEFSKINFKLLASNQLTYNVYFVCVAKIDVLQNVFRYFVHRLFTDSWKTYTIMKALIAVLCNTVYALFYM